MDLNRMYRRNTSNTFFLLCNVKCFCLRDKRQLYPPLAYPSGIGHCRRCCKDNQIIYVFLRGVRQNVIVIARFNGNICFIMMNWKLVYCHLKGALRSSGEEIHKILICNDKKSEMLIFFMIQLTKNCSLRIIRPIEHCYKLESRKTVRMSWCIYL